MNAPHLHLILNHVPTVGTAVSIGLLLLALLRRQEALTRVSLELFYVLALLTLPAYLSGVATSLQLEKLPDISVEAVRKHHDGAMVGFSLILVTGLMSWLGLWHWRRASRRSGLNTGIVLVLALLTLTAMAGTATMGGEIRHPEIIPEGGAPTAGPSWLTAAAVQALVTDHVWLWPALEAVHFIGLWMLFGVVLLVNLRMLGMMRSASFAALHRLLPWCVLGLGINIVSGMMWVIATPEQYLSNVSFFWKIGFLLLAGINLLYLTTFDEPWRVGAGEDASFGNKALAFSAIASWVCVMYFGRMLPFLGNAF
jgi:hypothetical protein